MDGEAIRSGANGRDDQQSRALSVRGIWGTRHVELGPTEADVLR
jgi:hypothetical protein